jgi:KDO2-lipid IV(A) lauroyltransferase
VRARALAGWVVATRWVPPAVLGFGLRTLARAARFSRFEERTMKNLELAMGAQLSLSERKQIAAQVRLHAARLAQEWLFLAGASHSLAARTRVERWLDETVELDPSCALLFERSRQGLGNLIATAHLGNWEVLAAVLHRQGLEGAVVGLRKRKDPSADWLVQLRSGLGVRTLAQDAAPREILGVLRGGATLGVLCDLEVRRLAGVHVPFFGTPALTQTAPAALARAARMPIFPVRCVAQGARYRISVEAPLEYSGESDKQAATLELLTRLNAVYERWIRADPGQWAWHQPRWRTRPGERASPPLHSRLE